MLLAISKQESGSAAIAIWKAGHLLSFLLAFRRSSRRSKPSSERQELNWNPAYMPPMASNMARGKLKVGWKHIAARWCKLTSFCFRNRAYLDFLHYRFGHLPIKAIPVYTRKVTQLPPILRTCQYLPANNVYRTASAPCNPLALFVFGTASSWQTFAQPQKRVLWTIAQASKEGNG